jgi:hypothetical protein
VIAAIVLTFTSGSVTIAGEAPGKGHDKPGPFSGLLQHCHPQRLGRHDGRASPQCLRALIQHPSFGAMLEDMPAFRDGRLSAAKLLDQARRDRLVPDAQFPRNEDPGEMAAREHLEADGRTLKFLTREEVAELVNAEGFEAQRLNLDPRFGPTELQNWPPVPPPDPFPLPGPGLIPPPPNPNNLNIGEFLTDMHAMLAPNVNGYALRIRRMGETVGVLQWNWARNPNLGDDPGLGWNSSRRMHIASISKFMTAIGLAHLLENTGGIDADSPIWPWLPAYWNRTAGANEFITFDNLMDHRSGFSTGGSASDWTTMKTNVEAGVQFADIGDDDYENMNFGLIRILIATIGGYIHPNTDFGNSFFNDLLWNAITWAAYDDYMQTYVFGPVGANPNIDSSILTVLGYRFDGTGPGWDSGDFSGSPGGVGWHMTVSEILDVTRALTKGQLISIGGFADIISRSWGLNSPLGGESTAAGNIYYKAGRWTTNVNNPAAARTEQCFVLFQPTKEIEVVVFVNSNVGAGGASLTNIVRNAFTSNIQGP